MQSNDGVLRVYGLWRDHYSITIPGRSGLALVHAYDAPIPTTAKPRVGSRVQVIAIARASYRAHPPARSANVYDVYDPQIVGVVIGLCITASGRVTYAVQNERTVSTVELVVISMPNIAGAKGNPVDEDCPRGWLRQLLLRNKSDVELWTDAEVLDDLGCGVTPVRVLRYSDPAKRSRSRSNCFQEPVWRPWFG